VTKKRKVGRPKHWLKEPPEYFKNLNSKPDSDLNWLLESINKLEAQLRAGELKGMPTQLLAGLLDFEGSFKEEREHAHMKYVYLTKKIKEGQHSGGAQTQENAQDRWLEICKKNKPLISQIKPNGRQTINSVAKRIRDEWEQRGAGEKVLSINTLTAYIKKYQQSHI